jgi:hypothetical protein
VENDSLPNHRSAIEWNAFMHASVLLKQWEGSIGP